VCRFLRARKWDVPAALAMFEAAEAWRKDFGVDELYKNFEYPEKEEVDRYYPQFYHKTDKVRGARAHCGLRASMRIAGRARTSSCSIADACSLRAGWPANLH